MPQGTLSGWLMKDKKHLTWNNTTMHVNKPKWPGLQKQCLFVCISFIFWVVAGSSLLNNQFYFSLSPIWLSCVSCALSTAEKPVSGERCKRLQLHGVHNSLLKLCKVGLNNLLCFFNQKLVLRWRESTRYKDIYESNKSLLLLQEQNIENIQT